MLTTLALLFVLSCNFVVTTSAASLGEAAVANAQANAQHNALVRINALKSARQVVAIRVADGLPRIEENTPEFEALVKACDEKLRELIAQQAAELTARMQESAEEAAAREARERVVAARRKPISERTNSDIGRLSGAAIGHMTSATASAGYKTLAAAWNYVLAPAGGAAWNYVIAPAGGAAWNHVIAPAGGAAWNHVFVPAGRRVSAWLSDPSSAEHGAVDNGGVAIDVNAQAGADASRAEVQDFDQSTVAGRLLARRAAAQAQE